MFAWLRAPILRGALPIFTYYGPRFCGSRVWDSLSLPPGAPASAGRLAAWSTALSKGSFTHLMGEAGCQPRHPFPTWFSPLPFPFPSLAPVPGFRDDSGEPRWETTDQVCTFLSQRGNQEPDRFKWLIQDDPHPRLVCCCCCCFVFFCCYTM